MIKTDDEQADMSYTDTTCIYGTSFFVQWTDQE